MTDVCELLDRVRKELVGLACINPGLMLALDNQLEACRDDGDQWWAVLLLWPETRTDDYGKDTYRTFVEAETPAKALELARQQAAASNNAGWFDVDAEPMHLLSMVKGKVFSYDDGCGGVVEAP